MTIIIGNRKIGDFSDGILKIYQDYILIEEIPQLISSIKEDIKQILLC